MKWTFLVLILLTTTVKAQTIDTFSHAIGYASAFDLQLLTGVTNEGHPYVYGSKLNVSLNGVYSDAQLVKFDLTNKHVTSKTLVGNPQGISWTNFHDFRGYIYTVRGTGTREVIELNLKLPDSIYYRSLGNSSRSGSGFPYSFSFGRDSSIGVGNSSSPTSTDFALKKWHEDSLTHFGEPDPLNGYNYHTVSDTGNWVYVETGQSVYRIIAVHKITGQIKILLERNDVFMDLAAFVNGVFAYRNDQNKLYLLSNGDTTLVAPNYTTGALLSYRETKRFTDDNSAVPYISAFYDSPKKLLYYVTNTVPIFNHANDVFDSISFDGGVQPKGIGVMKPDKYDSNVVVFVGSPYGYIHKYYIAQDSVVTYGYPGLNVYSLFQLNDSIWYLSGYPSGTCVKWNTHQRFTAESWINGAYATVSATTNPKLIGYFASFAGFDHANDLTLVSGRYLCAVGNNIRDRTTSSVGVIDVTKDSMYGWDDVQMIHKSYVDIEAWGNKLLYSTNDGNNGIPYLYTYNPVTNQMIDSINLGFHSYGHIITMGDLLLGIAQDTSNETHTVDSTRFYKVNLSTKQLVYNKKTRSTINEVSYMPDGRIGINLTYTATPASVPVTVSAPKDFFLVRAIENRDYQYAGSGDYFCVDINLVRHNNISSYIIDQNTKSGREKISTSWLY